jgi:hypothetical protein
MAKPLVLDEFEKKASDMLKLQHELSSKIASSEQLIAGFCVALESLKDELASKQSVERFVPSDFATLESALHEKQDLIKTLVEDIASLRGVVETKDSHLLELKEKLAEKVKIATENEARAVDLKDELLESKKELLRLKNEISIFDSKFIEGDSENKRLLAELMRTKDDLTHTQAALEDLRKLVSEERESFKSVLSKMKADHEETVKRLVNESLKRNVALATEVKHLRVRLDEQSKMLDMKARKERELTQDIVERMKDIISLRDDEETVAVKPVPPEVMKAEEEAIGAFVVEASREAAEEEEEELLGDRLRTLIGEDKYEDSFHISAVDDLKPMIETALDHGDSPEAVFRSLRSCGYSRKDIETAFSKIRR